MGTTDILLPTCNRLASLVMTLGGVAAQTARDLRVIVADQSERPVADDPVVETLGRVIEERGGFVEWHHRPPLHGIAEQRDFLLRQATADTVLYLDDDVLMESWVLERLPAILDDERCAFVGAFPAGLSHRHDRRPEQQPIDYWQGPVLPEMVEPESAEWERWQLHRAANLYHVAQSLPPGHGGATRSPGSRPASFTTAASWRRWGDSPSGPRLPRYHSGEEVLVQNLLMRRWGGLRHGPIRDLLLTGTIDRPE